MRARAGWTLGSEALTLIRHHPRLLWFPVLSALAFVAIVGMGLIALPLAFGAADGRTLTQADSLVLLASLIVVYLLLWLSGIFFSTALCACVLVYRAKGTMSVRDGLAVAIRRLPQIAGWALLAASVGVLLAALSRLLEERLSWLGTLLGVVLSATWSAAIYFVAPVQAVEGLGPIAATRRSIDLIRATWGETGGAQVYVAWILLPLYIVGALMVLALMYAALAGGSGELVAALTAGVVLLFAIASSLSAAMGGIVRSNLYLFAAVGEPPRGRRPDHLHGGDAEALTGGRELRRRPRLSLAALRGRLG